MKLFKVARIGESNTAKKTPLAFTGAGKMIRGSKNIKFKVGDFVVAEEQTSDQSYDAAGVLQTVKERTVLVALSVWPTKEEAKAAMTEDIRLEAEVGEEITKIGTEFKLSDEKIAALQSMF